MEGKTWSFDLKNLNILFFPKFQNYDLLVPFYFPMAWHEKVTIHKHAQVK